MPGRYVLGRVDGIYLKPTAKSAFPKETWLLKAKGDVILRLTLFDPKDPLGQDCSVVDAETFTRRPSAQAITHVAIHNFVVKAATGAGESAAGARLTISKDQQTWLDNNYAAPVARDVQALERGRRQHGTRPGPSKPQRGRMDRFKRCRREIYIRKSRRSSLSCLRIGTNSSGRSCVM